MAATHVSRSLTHVPSVRVCAKCAISFARDPNSGRRRVLLGVRTGGGDEVHLPAARAEFHAETAQRNQCLAAVPALLAPIAEHVSNITDDSVRAQVLAAVADTEAACNAMNRAAVHLAKKAPHPDAAAKASAVQDLFGTMGGMIEKEAATAKLLLDGHYEGIQAGTVDVSDGFFAGVVDHLRNSAPLLMGTLGKLAGAVPARASFEAWRSRVLTDTEAHHLHQVTEPPHPKMGFFPNQR